MNDGIFLLLGSNQGDRLANLNAARAKLEECAIKILENSAVYKTAPWGNVDQPDFFNQVLKVDTLLKPESLLETVLSVEQNLGRKRLEHWGPRIIDIDILFYGQQIINVPNLRIPHPRIPERRFTLIPLVELSPEFVHPETNMTLKTMLAICTDSLNVQKVMVSN